MRTISSPGQGDVVQRSTLNLAGEEVEGQALCLAGSGSCNTLALLALGEQPLGIDVILVAVAAGEEDVAVAERSGRKHEHAVGHLGQGLACSLGCRTTNGKGLGNVYHPFGERNDVGYGAAKRTVGSYSHSDIEGTGGILAGEFPQVRPLVLPCELFERQSVGTVIAHDGPVLAITGFGTTPGVGLAADGQVEREAFLFPTPVGEESGNPDALGFEDAIAAISEDTVLQRLLVVAPGHGHFANLGAGYSLFVEVDNEALDGAGRRCGERGDVLTLHDGAAACVVYVAVTFEVYRAAVEAGEREHEDTFAHLGQVLAGIGTTVTLDHEARRDILDATAGDRIASVVRLDIGELVVELVILVGVDNHVEYLALDLCGELEGTVAPVGTALVLCEFEIFDAVVYARADCAITAVGGAPLALTAVYAHVDGVALFAGGGAPVPTAEELCDDHAAGLEDTLARIRHGSVVDGVLAVVEPLACARIYAQAADALNLDSEGVEVDSDSAYLAHARSGNAAAGSTLGEGLGRVEGILSAGFLVALEVDFASSKPGINLIEALFDDAELASLDLTGGLGAGAHEIECLREGVDAFATGHADSVVTLIGLAFTAL